MIAQIFGFCGLALIVAAWQFRARRTILLLNIAAFLLFGIEQYLLEAPVGAVMMLGAIAIATAGLFRPSWLLAILLISVPLLVAIPFSRHWYDALPLIAHCTGAIAFLQRTTARLRLWAPVGTILWAVFNVIVGAWGQFLADLFILTSMVFGHFRNESSPRRGVSKDFDELP